MEFTFLDFHISADCRLTGLCTALDDLSEQDKTAEILPILVQQLYVLSRLGKTTEAEALASEISVVEYEIKNVERGASTHIFSVSPILQPRKLRKTILSPRKRSPRTRTSTAGSWTPAPHYQLPICYSLISLRGCNRTT